MATPSFSVICAYAGSSSSRDKTMAIIGKLHWSEEPSFGIATTNVAPGTSDASGQAVFHINAAADSWVSIGKIPNAAASPRFLAKAGVDYDLYAEGGDKLVWIAA